MTDSLKIAHLDDKGMEKVRSLESTIGKHVLALESGPEFASLSAEQVQKVKALENELGITLVVYED